MNNQIASTTATYQNAYTAETVQSDLPEQPIKRKFLSYQTDTESDVQKLINKNHQDSVGLNSDNLYVGNAFKTAEKVGNAISEQIEMMSNRCLRIDLKSLTKSQSIATVPDDATSADQPTEPSTSQAESTTQSIATSTPEAIAQETKKSTSDISNDTIAASPPSETSTVTVTSPSVAPSASAITTLTTIDKKAIPQPTTRQIASSTHETTTQRPTTAATASDYTLQEKPPSINPVSKLESNTVPTHQTHGMTGVQPDPGKSSDHPGPISGKTSTPPAMASTPGTNGQSAITPANYPVTDNLTLANMLAAKISDRPIHLNHTMAPGTTGKSSSPLEQSPVMQLLTDSLALARQLRKELTALANDLAPPDRHVSTQWNQDDLINLAIVQTLPETSAGKATENFLSSVPTSTTVGIQHQKPDKIFRADGSLRGTSQAPDTPLFHDPSTGQTVDHGATRQLAKIIIDRVAKLHDRQPEKFVTRLGQWLGLEQASSAGTRASLVKLLEQRLTSSQSAGFTPPTDLPLLKGLVCDHYQETQSRFMNLTPAGQLEHLKSGKPDYLGLDHFAEPLARLEANFATSTHSKPSILADPDQPLDRQPRNWRTFQLNQKALQLFTHLYNARFEAPAEAINRIKTAALIQRHGIEPHPDEAQCLNQLVVTLLPGAPVPVTGPA